MNMPDTSYPIEQVVYVPSTNKQQKPISEQERTKRIAEVKRFLSNKFGGYTAEKVVGGYTTHGGKLVQEGIVKVTSFSTKKAYQKNKQALHSQLKNWGKKWGQESMGYEKEGDLFYINSNGKAIAKKPHHKKIHIHSIHPAPSTYLTREIKGWA